MMLGRILANALAVVPAAALAQQPAPDKPGTPEKADSEAVLEEIVVTAQFRSERLQDTPLAISAFTAENIESRGITSTVDLAAFVPNAVIQPLGAGWGSTMAAYIRGVGLGDNILSFEPGVPIYIDDVYHGRPQGAIMDLLDLERVEVLRGPQGTLFGKNALGGTVRLISKKPQGDGSGYLSATLGSRDRIDLRGMADLSLIDDRLLARFSFSSKKADGYFRVLDYECVNGPGSAGSLGSRVAPDTGCTVDTLGDENVQSARAAFRLLAGDAEINWVSDYTTQRQKGPADKYTVMDPAAFLNTPWNDNVAVPTFGVPWDPRFITDSNYTNYNRYDDPLSDRLVPNVNNLDHWGSALTVEMALSERMSFKSITAYRQFWNKFGRDSDGSPLPMNHTYDDNRHRQFTQEFQLTGTAGRIDWATGAFYYDAHDTNRGFDFLLPGVIYQQDAWDRQDTTNWAVFVHGTYRVTDALSITAGARYTDDDKTATIRRTAFDGTVVVDDAVVNPQATKVSPMLSFNYDWSEDFMTYLKYSTGFRGGGFSPRPSAACQVTEFAPDELENLEIGAKSELAGRRVRLNGALFYSRHTDQQNFLIDLDCNGGVWFHQLNAGKARIWGVELELLAEPTDGLRIEGSFGYTNYYVTDQEGTTVCQRLPNGDPCYGPRTPEFNAGLGLQYSFAAPGGSSFTPRLDATYQSRISFVGKNEAFFPVDSLYGYQDAYTLVNGRFGWRSPDEEWEVALYGRNLTDEEYFNGKLDLVALLGREQGNVAAPREWGLTFKRSF